MTSPAKPTISVIILNFNGRRHLGAILDGCVASVLASDYPCFEALFVDNASMDDSVSYIEAKFGKDKRLRFVRNERNLGFTEGNNVGIRQARGEYVVLLNTDTKVDSGWLRALVEAAKPAEVGAVQSKLVQMGNPQLLDCAGGLVDAYGYHFERGRGEPAAKYNRAAEVFYGKGACLLLKRSVLAQTGLFDPEIFLYFDEVDLCWRIWLSGHKVVYAPDSLVQHASGSTASSLQSARKQFFYTRNHLMVLLKNYDLTSATTSATASLLFEARNVALFLTRRKPLASWAILNGILWNVAHLRRTWAERQRVQRLVRKVPDERIRRQMLKPYQPFPLYIVHSRTKRKN
jgi:GT2 family glycosyltransferase